MQRAGGASAESTSELADLLIEGARYNDLEDVRTALSQGVSVDAQDEQGRTGAQPAPGALRPCSCEVRGQGRPYRRRHSVCLRSAPHGVRQRLHRRREGSYRCRRGMPLL